VPKYNPNICKDKGYFTVHDEGRLGNKIGEYGTLYGMSKYFQVLPVISGTMKRELIYLFPNLTIPSYGMPNCNITRVLCSVLLPQVIQMNKSQFHNIMSNCATSVILRYN
jgi:hypothetical protein